MHELYLLISILVKVCSCLYPSKNSIVNRNLINDASQEIDGYHHGLILVPLHHVKMTRGNLAQSLKILQSMSIVLLIIQKGRGSLLTVQYSAEIGCNDTKILAIGFWKNC